MWKSSPLSIEPLLVSDHPKKIGTSDAFYVTIGHVFDYTFLTKNIKCSLQIYSIAQCASGLVVWPIRGQITRFWLLFFLLGLKKKVWPFGYFLASFYFKVMLGKCFDLSLIIYV